jgi:hypothetical protein
MESLANQVIALFAENNPKGCLWILEPHQLRIRKPKT